MRASANSTALSGCFREHGRLKKVETFIKTSVPFHVAVAETHKSKVLVGIDGEGFCEIAHNRKLKQPRSERLLYVFTPNRSNPVEKMFLVKVACPRSDKSRSSSLTSFMRALES